MRVLILVLVATFNVYPWTAAPRTVRDRTLTFGDWTVMLSDDKKDLIAATLQDSDKILGYRCFTTEAKCVHVIVAATGCEEGEKYPILINSSSGSYMVQCLCRENANAFELLPLDWDGFHRTLTESDGFIGFAIPLESGHFKVIRFSLRGATDAMQAAETAVRKADTAEYK